MKKIFAFIPLTVIVFFGIILFAWQVSAYTIQKGDTLWSIAHDQGTTVESLIQTNDIQNPDLIYAGDELEILLGADIPSVIALFEDSLASRISDSATSFTLVRGTDKQSRSLNGFYGFVIDEGTTSEEFLTANCVSTSCTVVGRGIDVQDGETEVTALKFEHRRGAVVKITNFPQLAILSRILGGYESASSTLMFGSGTTDDDKTLYADTGESDLPFLRYNQTLGNWQFSDDGVSSITFVTSSAGGLSASGTAGIVFVDSEVAVYNSSTASINGGFMKFSSDGRLFWDVESFLSSNWSWSGAQTFDSLTATTTADTLQITSQADTDNDAANLGTVKSYVSQGHATGTAGMAISAGEALYVSTTGTLFLADADAPTSTYFFVGIALEDAAVTEEAVFARPGETVCGLSLTAGVFYYLSGTAGAIATTGGTYHAKIGRSISSGCLVLTDPKFIARGVINTASTGNVFAYTGFYPAHIDIRVGLEATGIAEDAISIGDDGNRNVAVNASGENANDYDTTYAWTLDNSSGSLLNRGTVASKSAQGFTVNVQTHNDTAQIQWVAYSE